MRVAWLLWLATVARAARLLVVLPTNTKSHYAMYSRLIEALAKRDHQLTVITHFPVDAPQPNINQISLAGTIPEITNNLTRKYDSLKPNFIRNLEQIISECVNACETVVQQDSFKELLNSTASFDLIIVEVFGSDCFLPLGHRFRAPVVGLLSSVPLPWVNDYLGNPETASYIPSYMMGYGQHMSLWERLSNTIAIILAKILYTYKSRIPSQVIVDRVFGHGNNLQKLAKNYSVILSNSHFSINEVRPLVPGLVEVGGLHLDHSQTLPKNMKKLLDASTDGVIYWSFGSMSRIETIPSEKLSGIFEAISELPQLVFVKMDRRRLTKNITVPDNVYTMDWIPQYATLCHPNVKLFISHGGLLGTQEAVACGVPMLMVPLYADQALNSQSMFDKNVARILDLHEADKYEWKRALHDLLSNKKYRENSKTLKEIFLDRPINPLDMGVYWIEYVLRYRGAPHMRSPALDLSLSQYLLFDVIIINITITIVSVFILHALFKYLCTKCIKWCPKEKIVIEKRLFKNNVTLFVCLLRKCKVKIN
ncbi:UDP-glycosyltransferase UGT47A1 precursor [Bombyx mori]|uniref:UDP-glycosyltransferase UGT47A1 n=1 Tax=Bombyx mori TaxID=7091 RepID=G9LPW3_BOMMO|nr:UDP-glycosyltransferase UGT47A1 precursor [Bombyx mori]AEW43186.1 UDP-glycosyltransferase UGT47A1 [Bombyx mori]